MTKNSAVQVTKYNIDKQPSVSSEPFSDHLIAEQPLQIVIHWFEGNQWREKELVITMRTPGDDSSLVIGFLLSQNIIKQLSDIKTLNLIEDNIAAVHLNPDVQLDWQRLSRTFVSHSGCGICGQSQLKSLTLSHAAFAACKTPWLSVKTIVQLPELLRDKQSAFTLTGGCHGAGLWFEHHLSVCEDVGRHNAVDKVIGRNLDALLSTSKPAYEQAVLVLSGRISFELVQKAIAARVSVIIAVGAPSDLAVTTAKQFKMTLIGFTKPNAFNVYSGQQRITHEF